MVLKVFKIVTSQNLKFSATLVLKIIKNCKNSEKNDENQIFFFFQKGKPVGETHLYFGCRNKDKDFIYREELEKYVEDGVLTLHTAFSRDQPEKIYVTHR